MMKIIIFLTIFLVLFLMVFLRYRIVYGKKIEGESELIYKMIDVGQHDYFRYSFESILRKNRVYLKNGVKDLKWIYISDKDFDNLCPVSPLKMKEENYTLRFKFEIKRLIFGGYGIAKVTSYNRINKRAEVYKS